MGSYSASPQHLDNSNDMPRNNSTSPEHGLAFPLPPPVPLVPYFKAATPRTSSSGTLHEEDDGDSDSTSTHQTNTVQQDEQQDASREALSSSSSSSMLSISEQNVQRRIVPPLNMMTPTTAPFIANTATTRTTPPPANTTTTTTTTTTATTMQQPLLRRRLLSQNNRSSSMSEVPDWSHLDPHATALDLSHHPNVRSDSLPALVETLVQRHCHSLRDIDLSNNHLGTKGIQKISPLLTHPQAFVQTMRLARNGLKGRRAMRRLVAACADNKVLRCLDISHNQLHDKSITTDLAMLLDSRRVACRLTELDLSNNGSSLTDKSAWALAEAMVEGNNTTLQILRLSGNALGPAGGDALGTLLNLSHSLQELYVANCNLGDEGVQYICKGLLMAQSEPALRILDLAWNVLHDDAAYALADLLEHNSSLQCIQLECNGIGDKGAAALAAALPRNDALVSLDVRGNQIHDCGAIALAVALVDPRCLSALELHWEMNAHMTHVGRHRIQGALQLRVSRQQWLNALLQSLQGLRQFPAIVCTAGDDEVVEICKHVAKQQRQHPITLPVVRFKGPGITLRGVKAIANQLLCPPSVTLTHLYLLHTHMGDDGANLLAQALLRNTSLTTLTCMDCEWTEEGALYLSRALPRHSRLGRLDLRQNRIGTEGARALLHAITEETPNIHTLYLSKNGIGDAAVRSLSTVGHLVTLNLADNLLTDAAALDLARICGNIATPSASNASAMHEIKWLDISRNYLTKRGIQALDLFLPELSTLDASHQHDSNARQER